MIARIGGDEFAILLLYSDAAQAARVADDLRRVVRECSIKAPGDEHIHLSISIGVSAVDETPRTDEELFAEADHAMYDDKRRAVSPPDDTA